MQTFLYTSTSTLKAPAAVIIFELRSSYTTINSPSSTFKLVCLYLSSVPGSANPQFLKAVLLDLHYYLPQEQGSSSIEPGLGYRLRDFYRLS